MNVPINWHLLKGNAQQFQILACEQALLWGKSRKVTREPHAKRDVSAKGAPSRSRLFLRLASLATRNRELKLKKKNLSISKIKQGS